MILAWLSQYRDIGLLFLRAGIGTMMVIHGWPKLAGGIHQWEKLGKATSAIGINVFPGFWGFSSAMVETIGGVLIVLGCCFRPVTILMTLNSGHRKCSLTILKSILQMELSSPCI